MSREKRQSRRRERQALKTRSKHTRPRRVDHPALYAVEPVLAGILGLILFIVDARELAELTWIFGGLQAVGRLIYSQLLQAEMSKVDVLAESVDLSQSMSVDKVREILSLYLAIPEEEFRAVKDRILTDAATRLGVLAHDKRSDTLRTTEYYGWLLPILERAKKGTEVWAVSMMLDCEWVDDPPEEEFLKGNLSAAERGALVRRVFVIPEDKKEGARENKALVAHADPNSGLHGLAISRDYLQRSDPQLLEELGDGLIAFDRRVALIDKHSEDGAARGVVTMNLADIDRWRQRFDDLVVQSRDLAEFLGFDEKDRRS